MDRDPINWVNNGLGQNACVFSGYLNPYDFIAMVKSYANRPIVRWWQCAAEDAVLVRGRNHAASEFCELRRYAQSISGRSSSHRTAPPVAFSMSGHLPVGIGLFPRTHWFTVGTETPKILAKAACPPVFSQAFVMGSFVFMPHY